MANQKQNKTYVGTELKMHIGFSYPADTSVTLDSMHDFIAEFYCEEDTVQTFHKSDLIYETGEYYAPVDTTITGPGELKMKFTAYIPDSKFDDGYRTEIGKCVTNVVIE